jgi:hypothetical protein
MQWKYGSQTSLDLGGRLHIEVFVEKDVKFKVFKEIHDQTTRITKRKHFHILSVLILNKSLPIQPNA